MTYISVGRDGPSCVSESARTTRAPAIRAPTSYVGYDSSGMTTVWPSPTPSRNGSHAMASFVPTTGSTPRSADRPTTPWRRSIAPAIAARNSGVPAVCGYPGTADAAAKPARADSKTSSTGVPIDRSIIPSGCAAARALAPASESHGNAGNRPAGVTRSRYCGGNPVMRAYSSACGGSAAMNFTSKSCGPSLAAPPGEPSSSNQSTLASVYSTHSSGTSSS